MSRDEQVATTAAPQNGMTAAGCTCSAYYEGQRVVVDRTRCPIHSPLRDLSPMGGGAESVEGQGEMSNKSSAATVEWQRFDYEHGETIWQRECPYCDRGLLLAPVRFCQRCQGSGYLTTTVDPTRAES